MHIAVAGTNCKSNYLQKMNNTHATNHQLYNITQNIYKYMWYDVFDIEPKLEHGPYNLLF